MTSNELAPKRFLVSTHWNKCEYTLLHLKMNLIESFYCIKQYFWWVSILLSGSSSGNLLSTTKWILLLRGSYVQYNLKDMHLDPWLGGLVWQYVCDFMAAQVPNSQSGSLLSDHQSCLWRFSYGRLHVNNCLGGFLLPVSIVRLFLSLTKFTNRIL